MSKTEKRSTARGVGTARRDFLVIRDGVSADMQGYGDQIADEDIWHLVNYIRSLAR